MIEPAGEKPGECCTDNRRQPEQPELADIVPDGKQRGAVLRAGLTEVLVTGIMTRWIKVRHRPIGMPAKPTAAPCEVEPTITKRKKNVATTSPTKQATKPYF